MGRNRLVLIVDEDPAARANLAAMLKGAPLAVVADCGYGVEAGALAEETRPDLIIAAVEEPVARAVQTLRAMRSILPRTPIVVHTSVTDMSVVRQVLQVGVADLLPRPLDPAGLLAAIRLALSNGEESSATAAPLPAGTVLAVVGAKGGVGKSTLATNLGAAIARDTHHSVLLMDMDTRFGDIAIMLDLEPRLTVADLAADIDHLDRQTFRGALIRHASGVYVLPAPRHPGQWRNVGPEEIRRLVQFAARLFDYVILDTPGTFNDLIATALEVATEAIVVTSKDLASIKDTAYLLELLETDQYPADRLQVVLNDSNHNTLIKTEDVEAVLNRRVRWTLPYDSRVMAATQEGTPVLSADPRANMSRAIAAMAMEITGPDARKAPAHPSGRLRRLIPGRRRASAAVAAA